MPRELQCVASGGRLSSVARSPLRSGHPRSCAARPSAARRADHRDAARQSAAAICRPLPDRAEAAPPRPCSAPPRHRPAQSALAAPGLAPCCAEPPTTSARRVRPRSAPRRQLPTRHRSPRSKPAESRIPSPIGDTANFKFGTLVSHHIIAGRRRRPPPGLAPHLVPYVDRRMKDQEPTGRKSRRPLAGGLIGLSRLQDQKPPNRAPPGFQQQEGGFGLPNSGLQQIFECRWEAGG